MNIDNAPAVIEAVAQRHRELTSILAELDDEATLAPSLLPGWNRLTVICHLRYGAEANLAMTRAVVAGGTASFYPERRAVQRPSTLGLRPGEDPGLAIRSLAAASAELDALWASFNTENWSLRAVEPDDNPDLGPTTLGFLTLLRLTEVEVHGTDLDAGATSWSDVFVDTALPMRIRWLSTRRTNSTASNASVVGTWILKPHEATPFTISATTEGISVFEGDSGDAVIAGSKRELLAFLLGRTPLATLAVSGDHDLAARFKQAFPSP